MSGYCLGAPTEDSAVSWLLALVVDPTARRRGIGRDLMGAALEGLSRIGTQTAYLTVAEANTAARTLYRSLKFEVARQDSAFYGPGEPRLVMARSLHD